MMISQQEYVARRQRVLSLMAKNSIAVISAAPLVIRNGQDTEFAYRQNSDFYYLTGFTQPEAVILLLPGRKAGEFVLFNQPKDKAKEIWTGIRPGQAGACEEFGANEAFDIAEFEKKFPEFLAGRSHIYYAFGRSSETDHAVLNAINQLRAGVRSGVGEPMEMTNIETILHDMRLRKSQAEIDTMRTSASISAHAHIRAMKVAKPGMKEYQLQAEIEYHCIQNGSIYQSYTPIVAGGKNACILHYTTNLDTIHDGDLVLIDAGGEHECYASDITRTFPINGKFSPAQKAIYEAVLETQVAVIEKVKPGVIRDELEQTAVRLITTKLVELGILKGKVDELIERGAYRDFYMHRIGHWLGLDTHDVGQYKINGQSRPLEAGMVLTVEPGIYIAHDAKDVDAKWRGIGVRIEDDILVTSTGYEVLTHEVPKTVADIEALMAKK